ncbi:MAG: membrane protein insertion efficiency factor YidD [Candidatus Eremiobacteraeota bacterium]|nr:membrane protein insertion efficiency factor YidD [Candidatus Eremiobacteraeota bacterium]
MRELVILMIRLYQFLRKPFPPVCRFTPSCSQYTLEAVAAYGFWKGTSMGVKRILKCHPFHKGGYDPVK